MSASRESERLPFGSIIGANRPVAMAGVIFDDKHDRFLVVRHEGEERWQPPTTGLRDGERLVAGAARAVLEQTGIEVESVVESFMIAVQEHVTHPQRPITIGWRFTFYSGAPTPGTGLAEATWMPDKAHWPMSDMADDCLRAAWDGDRIWVNRHDGQHAIRAKPAQRKRPQDFPRHLRAVDD
jgi:ADP-ribose pyrophosphatase YjhB (NUDIX family)